MPIRIYDIAQKLGVGNKDVLIAAKALGISAAKVPSSSLDKITGEFLLEQMQATLAQTRKPATPAPVNELQRAMRPDSGTIPPATIAPSRPAPGPPPFVQAEPSPASPAPAPRHVSRISSGEVVREREEKSSVRFEKLVRRLLDRLCPNSTLSNVLLFHSERARFVAEAQEQMLRSDYAFELDHLLHRADATTDNLVVVECKNQSIRVQDERTWLAQYETNVSNVQQQMRRHADALRAYVNPLSRGRSLKIDILLVSSDRETKFLHYQAGPDVSFYLCNDTQLSTAMTRVKPPPLRVAQSDILNLIRLGMPTAELGHPELNNALAYIERCRRSIDVELFRAFSPTTERWAINGSAGMGKSVLLAYSLFVLTTNRRVGIQNGQRALIDFAKEGEAIRLPPLGQRGVYAFALKEKQRQVISALYRRFVEDFAALSKDVDLGVSRPAIRLWNGIIPSDCQVLLIDEAHDLSAADAAKLATWANAEGQQRYLLIACDRHQKLRLVGRDETIIEGVNFSRKTKKLRLNYRNPFAVYAASLGLMFRWFSGSGPKVLPSKDDLENGFGFTVEAPEADGRAVLSMRNDAHPANSWSHCVEWFPNPETAVARLRPFRFKPQDVLWVRFADEDEHFDYEQLSCFTYHNLNCAESVELTDKYIKGQDFPIVVIEGFSEDMNQWKDAEAEQRMWQRRKELYVCASRATAFLFLVAGQATADATAAGEFHQIVRQLSAPIKDEDGFPRTWRFTVAPSTDTERRKMDVFTDAKEG